MAVVGRGRIVVWEGASLWLLENADQVAEVEPHAHHAIQLTIPLRGNFEIGVERETLSGSVTAVASDQRHTFRGRGAVAFLFIAPESQAGRALSAAHLTARSWALEDHGPLAVAAERLREGFARDLSAQEFRELGQSVVAALAQAARPELPDRRVLAMIDYARSRLDVTVTLPAAAAHVHLSEGRARHLFAEHTQMPFKAYVLWLRLERAVELYAQGHSLTEAAHEAGFADSAHLSRTFRRTFGLPAAALRLTQD